MEELLKFEGIEYGGHKDKTYLPVIKKAAGIFYSGRVYAVIGQSMKEKAALLSVLSGIEAPHKGAVYFKGEDIQSIGRESFLRRHAGVLMQAYPCIPHLTALENAMLSTEESGSARKTFETKAADMLKRVGLSPDKTKRRASRLSFVEQQAVGLVRALLPGPGLLFVEEKDWGREPDLEHGMTELLLQAAHVGGVCVVVAAASSGLSDKADEVWGIRQGVLLPLKTE